MKRFMKRIEEILETGGIMKDIALLAVSGVALLVSIFDLVPLPFDVAWISVILCGIPIILEAVIGLVTAFDIKADVLVSIALIASLCIGEDFAAGEVVFIMQLGALLEDLTVAKARAGIEKLVRLTPQTARVIKNGKEETVPAERVRVGDILRVLPGETIPVDGVICSGQTSINQAVMTGESMPVDKKEGDEVSSGTVNQFGAFDMEAVKVGEDSSIQRMIKLVQSANAGKAKIVSLADRWATWIVVIALSAALITGLITGEIIRAVTILVVFCPCALVLATPTAIMAAIGNATKHGFLVKEGDALERLAGVRIIAFDKTGTLTCGNPCVISVKSISENFSENEVYRLAASAERLSEHPLGKAIVSSYQQRLTLPFLQAEDFQIIPGNGVSAMLDGRKILVGKEEFLKNEGITVARSEDIRTYLQEGCTIICIAAGKEHIGYIILSDMLRKESMETIEKIKQFGAEPVLLTGDNENAAQHMARKLRIGEVYAGCLPEDKLQYIDGCRKNGKSVCMIGDGVNDAPALKMADVGIAMGGIGSDIAVDAADIALVDDKVGELPHLLSLSKRMMTTIKWNLTFSMILNFAAITLAITGILSPVVGALVHNAGSVLVIINSAFLLKWRKKR